MLCAWTEIQRGPSRGETVNTAKDGLNCILEYQARVIEDSKHRHDLPVAQGRHVGWHRDRQDIQIFQVLVETESAGGNNILNIFWNYPFGQNVYNLLMAGDMELCVKESCQGQSLFCCS